MWPALNMFFTFYRQHEVPCDYLILVLLGGTVLFPFLGQDWRWSSREIRHAQIIREMARSGDFVIPRLLGKVYVDKPPVMHGTAAALIRWCGFPDSLTTARLPSALAGILGVLATYGLGRLLAEKRSALLAAVALLGMAGYVNMARQARPDMILATAILISCWALAAAMRRTEHASRAILITLSGLAAGVGTVTKGPYGLLFPILFLTIAPIRRKDFRRPRWELIWFGLGAALAVGSWALPTYLRDGGQYLTSVLRQPDLTLHAEAHTSSVLYFAKSLATSTLPLILFLPLVVTKWRYMRFSAMLALAAVMLVVLSAVPSKRVHYLLPVYPFLALGIADGIVFSFAPPNRLLRVLTWGLVMLSVAGSILYYAVVLPMLRPRGDPMYEVATQVNKVVPVDVPLICLGGISEEMSWVRGDYRRVLEVPTFPSGTSTYILCSENERNQLFGLIEACKCEKLLDLPMPNHKRWFLYRWRAGMRQS